LEELVRAGLIEEAQAAELVDEHERTGKPTKDVALEMGLITEDQGLDLISQLMGAERVDLEHMSVPAETSRRCRASRACTTSCRRRGGQHRHAGRFEPDRPETGDEIRFVLTKDAVRRGVLRRDRQRHFPLLRFGRRIDEGHALEPRSELEGAGTCWKAARAATTSPPWRRRPTRGPWCAS
jgi:hypothetical protein